MGKYPLNRSLGGPQYQSGCLGEQKSLLSTESNPRQQWLAHKNSLNDEKEGKFMLTRGFYTLYKHK
jgi:hypothetical protein